MPDNSKTTLARLLQGIILFLIALSFSFNGWTAVKVIALDKEMSALKATAEAKYAEFEKDNEKFSREQRAMSAEVRKTHTTVIQIAAKLDIGG